MIFYAILTTMFRVQRFSSFEEAKKLWQTLESKQFHYPFQSWWYQNLFAKNFSLLENVYILGVFDGNTLVAIGGFELVDSSVILLGTKDVSKTSHLEQDLTDFGDLLISLEIDVASVWQVIISYFHQENFKTFDLRFVRQDSPTYTYFLKTTALIKQQETSPYITIPQTWDDYLSDLSRKDRHELRRKIKRFESQTAFSFCTNQTIYKKFANFIILHKLSDPIKERFMADKMEDFFHQIFLAEKSDWQAHICDLQIKNKTVASCMVFVNKTHMLLFNSGYNPAYSNLSVGLLLKAYLIKQSIERKLKVYDFLRGNERYKYDLGAKDMPLFRIQSNL